MTATSSKGYELQSTGSNAGTWGTTLNDSVITYIDDNMGGRTSKDLTGLTGGSATFSLTAAESRSAILYLFGTLSANITITTACVGFFFVENNTTGAFTITIKNSVAASGGGTFNATVAVVPQETRVALMSDLTQGVRIAGQSGFASGTVLVAYQDTAPIGWTTVTASMNNRALRVVSGSPAGGGTGGATGGTTAFTSVFTSRTITQANLPSYTLPDTFAIAGSQVGGLARNFSETFGTADFGTNATLLANTTWTDTTLSISGSVTSGGSGTAMDFAVQYASVIFIQKD